MELTRPGRRRRYFCRLWLPGAKDLALSGQPSMTALFLPTTYPIICESPVNALGVAFGYRPAADLAHHHQGNATFSDAPHGWGSPGCASLRDVADGLTQLGLAHVGCTYCHQSQIACICSCFHSFKRVPCRYSFAQGLLMSQFTLVRQLNLTLNVDCWRVSRLASHFLSVPMYCLH